MLYKNLSMKAKRLYKLAWKLGLTEWHYAAARILEQVNGYENAEGYLIKCNEALQNQTQEVTGGKR